MSEINTNNTLTDNQDLINDTPKEAFGQFNGANDARKAIENEAKQDAKKSTPSKTQNDDKKNAKNILEKAREEYKEKEASLIKLISEQYKCDLDIFMKMETLIHDDPEKATEIIELKNQIYNLQEEYKQLFPKEAIIAEFNKKHAVVHYNSKTQYMRINEDGSFILEDKKSLKDFYENKHCIIEGAKKKSVNIWLESEYRTTYTDMKLIPTNDPDALKKIKDLGVFNLWKGFKVPRIKGVGKGKNGRLLYWDHVFDNICQGSLERYKFIRGYLAHMFQRPDVLPETAIMLQGNPGTGKNTFTEPLLELLGEHGAPLTNMSRLVCKFNGHLLRKILVVVSESEWSGDKNDLATLKTILTESTISYEIKNKDVFFGQNCLHLIALTNSAYAMELEGNQRRFCVLKVSDKCEENRQYFMAIKNELKNGGLGILLDDLLSEPLENFDPRTIPSTEATFDMKLSSPNATVERYMQKVLEEGFFGIETLISDKAWGLVKKDDAFTDFTTWCRKENETFKNTTKGDFTKRLKALFPTLNKDSRSRKRLDANGNPTRYYEFPDLNTSREEFCKSLKTSFEIVFKDAGVSSVSGGCVEQTD